MLLTQYLLFLLLMLICELTNNTNQNDLSLLTNNYKQRVKRFLFFESDKSKLNSQTQSKNNQQEDILLNNGLYVSEDNEKQAQREPDKGFTQQELAEIKRILSKKEDDYYGILNIDKHTTPDKIISAYKKLALRVHPDKFNVPGATEATQRLNKARIEVLKKFQNQKQNNNQQTTNMFTTRSSTLTENKNREVTNIINESNLISTSSPLPSAEKRETSITSSFFNKSNYLLFASIILIIGIIILIIYWKKRQRHSSSSTQGNNSKKQNIPTTYDSSELNDGDIPTMNRNSDASIIPDEQ